MNNTHKQYTTNIAWSTVETVLFQSLLFLHQYILFKVTTPAFYGLIGTLFGYIYLSVKLLDLGVNKTLTSFFLDYSIDKKTTYRFLRNQLIPSIILYLVITIGLIIFQHGLPLP